MLAPLGRDAALASAMLGKAGLDCRMCGDIDAVLAEPPDSYGVILLAEEALDAAAIDILSAWLDAQPAWSNLPTVLLMNRGNRQPASRLRALIDTAGLGHGTVLLERPMRVTSFISIMRGAVLSRRRQYELRDQLAARQAAEAHARMLADELKHRIKNSLAIVSAMAALTFREGKPMAEAMEAFSGRLEAMALAQDVLTSSGSDGASLTDLVSQALEPYRLDALPDRIVISGPEVWIAGRMTTTLLMALHELATNAVKYGALSVDTGRLAVGWSVEAAPVSRLHLVWRERGGPQVTPPKRRGFGSRLIERSLATELAGSARIGFEPEGVVCEISASLEGSQALP